MTQRRTMGDRMRASIAAAAMLFIAASSSLHAQGWNSIAPGTRVSIRIIDSLNPADTRRNAVVGTVLGRDSAGFYLRVTATDSFRVSHSSITRLEVSQGRSR